ncbi:hypothetical protein [Rhodopila sp.]|uniref:hypothetical protein n=1 Tax=Rhodopila sp. TaxID=2480087 RepID=UPI002D0D02F1|nr:hypothetical protein [Rhodopila sp.]HVZ07520.1 hypothetical protein [Rhodopila sp.]
MSNFVPFNRDQCFPLPPDLKDWLPADDVAHFIVAAVIRRIDPLVAIGRTQPHRPYDVHPHHRSGRYDRLSNPGGSQ